MLPNVRTVVLNRGYCAAARALFAYIAPRGDQKRPIDKFLRTLNTNGMFDTKFELFYLPLDTTDNYKVNWARPGSYSLTLTGAPTVTELSHFAGDGTSTKFGTGFTPSTNGTKIGQDSFSLGVGIRNNTSVDAHFDIGGGGSAISHFNSQMSTSGGAARGTIGSGTNDNSTVIPGTSVGVTILSRTGAAVTQFIKNGVQLGTDITRASTGLANGEMFICGTTAGFSARQITDAFLASGLTVAEALVYVQARSVLRLELGML